MKIANYLLAAVAFTWFAGCEAEHPPKATPRPPEKEQPKLSRAEPTGRGGSSRKPEAATEPAASDKKTDPPPPSADATPPADKKDDPPMEREKPRFKEPPAQEGWTRSKPLGGEMIWLETKGEKRRVLVATIVCLREGSYGLECLLCKRGTKEHESLLVTTANAALIHFAMEAAKMKAGSPVKYEPKFAPPTGDKVKITLLYQAKEKWVSVPGQQWIQHGKTKKDLEYDWVFAGSKFYKNPDEPNQKPIYLANSEGGIISISNVMTAMLDLPIDSPKGIDDRIYRPNTPRIPPLDTSVTVILEPVEAKKK